MLGWLGRLFGKRGVEPLTFDLSSLDPSKSELRPKCPPAQDRYILRKGGQHDYDITDGKDRVGSAFRMEGPHDKGNIWCVSVRETNRDVRSLEAVRAWLKGEDPPPAY